MPQTDDANPFRANLIVGTHHKSGTMWMQASLKTMAKMAGFAYLRYRKSLKLLDSLPQLVAERQGVLLRFEESSYIRQEDLDNATVVHVARDPRDMLVSATHYHQKATEKFLLRPWADQTGTLTYIDHISSLPSFEEKLMFEMDAYSKKVFSEMMRWPYDAKAHHELHFEDLMADTEMTIFRGILNGAGLTPNEVETCLQALWNNSLFGGLASRESQDKVRYEGTNHIRSGTAQQWVSSFTPDIAEAFCERYQPLLERYGYEIDDRWVEKVPDPTLQ